MTKGTTMLLSAGYVDGFDPSAPMRYEGSDLWVFSVMTMVAIIIVAMISGFAAFYHTDSEKFGWILGIGLGLALMAIASPVLLSTSPPYNAKTQAVQWADERYGVEIAEYDVEGLFRHFDCGDHEDDCTNTVLLDDGTEVTAKKISGKIILVDSESDADNGEMDVVYDD